MYFVVLHLTMATRNYTYRFRLQPTDEQRRRLAKHFGVCRFVYNHFLDRRNRLYRESKTGSTYYKDCLELTKLKKEFAWIAEANAQSLQHSLNHLDTAFRKFFNKKAAFPRFHSRKTAKQSFHIPQHLVLDGNRLKFPKFREGIRLVLHRALEGEIRHATVSMNRAGQYFVAIGVHREMKPLPKIKQTVGVDLGIKTLATLSNGQTYDNIRPYKSLERRVRWLHRKLSRTKKGSKSRERARQQLAKLHQRITNIRSNHLHQVSHQITRENQAIYLEDLNVAGMLKNRRLSKAVQDVSLSELVRQIEYKADWRSRTVTKIGRFYPSSKACSDCGFIRQDMPLELRTWVCPRCEVHHDRDLNAAKNILAEGKRTAGTAGIASGELRKTSARKLCSSKLEARLD